MDSTDPFGNGFASVKETAEYNMPPIPRVIIDKLDEFFRLVDAQHHTESIVILTYDTNKEGSEGWGVLVPEQTNTSVHCKYDADSIAALKPDDVMIVGSVHSHPNMPAYASGTDHADQADFDGIHITYGWQKSVNNNATQYHIELQIGGSSFVLDPEDVFESYTISKDPDPEVIEWSTKVKKATPLYTGGTQSTLNTGTSLHPQKKQTPNSAITTGTSVVDKSKFKVDLSSIESDALVAVESNNHATSQSCLMCGTYFSAVDINSSTCLSCYTPLISNDMGHFEIIEFLYSYCVDNGIEPTVAYYVYCSDDGVSPFLINIKPDKQDPIHLIGEVEDFVKVEYTLCCNTPLSTDLCTCEVTVLERDIYQFDSAHKNTDIYDSNSGCFNCSNYYQTSCPLYKQAVVDFMTHDKKVTQLFTICNSFVDYKNDTNYAYTGGMYE
jgi:hypothetical protein